MGDALGKILAFARDALNAEFMTPPGIVNLVAVLGGLAVALGTGLTDMWQALVRTWDPSYDSGATSGLILFAMYIGLALVCVLILMLFRRRG